MLRSLKSLLTGYIPTCLYTYETADARSKIIEFSNGYGMMATLVEEWFGENYMDNKITIVATSKETGSHIYISIWDGIMSIGVNIIYFKSEKGIQESKVSPKAQIHKL
jgi:hypothetical protein